MLVGTLFLRQVVQQLADAGSCVRAARRFVEAAGLHFHGGDLFADRSRLSGWDSQRAWRCTKPFTSWRRMSGMWSPKRCVKQLDQAAPVAGFLLAHAVEHGGRTGKIVAQALGEIGVDALVFFFQRDGQGEHFPLGQAFKTAHRTTIAGRGGSRGRIMALSRI